PQIQPLMIVAQEQLAAVLEVRVLDVDERVARVGQREEQLLLHRLELPRLDLVSLVAIGPREGEQLVLAAEVRRQELVDERDVIVECTYFENFLSSEAQTEV